MKSKCRLFETRCILYLFEHQRTTSGVHHHGVLAARAHVHWSVLQRARQARVFRLHRSFSVSTVAAFH